MAARFYLPSDQWTTSSLSSEESKHAAKVLRLKEGQEIELFDGAGTSARATLTEVTPKRVTFSYLEQHTAATPAPYIHLFQSIPKGKNMDLIVQKAVELGVNEITPVITGNTVAVSEDPQKKQQKWQRLAIEACKQCGQNYLTQINAPVAFSQLSWDSPATDSDTLKLVASLRENSKPLKDVLDHNNFSSKQKVSLFVGPEGDFTNQEVDLLEENNFIPCSLGTLILRVETATLFCLSSLRLYS